MPTTFTSLRVPGTATIATLVATAVTLTTVAITTLTTTTATITTGTVTTLDSTTAEINTLSGTTINALVPNGIVKARTLSGASIIYGGGTALGILCKKADGTIGTVVRSATGTISAGACT